LSVRKLMFHYKGAPVRVRIRIRFERIRIEPSEDFNANLTQIWTNGLPKKGQKYL
jgi:hypothetical protein